MSRKMLLHCPNCLYVVDTHTPLGDSEDVPTRGDVTICAGCGDFGVYEIMGDGLVIRRPDPNELDEILSMPNAVMMSRAIKTRRGLG